MNPTLQLLLVCLIAFCSGALPFSVWLGKLIAKRDVRELGDHNPGAMNAFLTGNTILGLLVLLLDVTKGVLPVILTRIYLGYTDWHLAVVAFLPVLGHAFSPFLKLRGGKALAVLLGVWIGLTIWKIPLIGVLVIVAAKLLIKPDAWVVAVTLTAMALGVILWIRDGWMAAALLGHAIVILWKHRSDFHQRPGWKLSRQANTHAS